MFLKNMFFISFVLVFTLLFSKILISMSEKLTELEEKFSFLDHTIEELNNVVFRQMKKIDELEEMIKYLSSQIEQLKDKSEGGMQVIDDKPPPHY
jgi:SlyX protein